VVKNFKKKILFVDHDLGLSGSTVSMIYLIEEFIRRGFKVFVLTKNNQQGVNCLKKSGAEIIPYSSSPFKSITLFLHFSDKASFLSYKWFKNLFKDIISFFNSINLSVKVISKCKPDLIYINEYVTIQFAIFARLKSIPVVVHIRSLFIDQKYNLRILLLKKVLRNIPDYNFAITELEANQIGKLLGKKTKIKVIPEFLNEENFEFPKNISEIKNNFKVLNSEKLVTFLGGISYIKGSINFISSIEYLSVNLSNVKFILAGNINDNKNSPAIYSYYTFCLEYLNRPKIKPFIKVTGSIENAKELISISDIVVSCSVETHFSRPVIEAWAQKKPIIASDIPHSTNLVDNGINGIIVPVNNPIELAKAIDSLLINENLCVNMGENGFLKANKIFSCDRNVREIINCCNECLMDF
jgi:glycosyltransferase involved in cell wall biosynthesis